MTYNLQIVQLAFPLGFLAIKTDFLWHLVLIFGGVAALCFLLIFYFRNRLASRGKNSASRKAELAPMIHSFLMHQTGSPGESGGEPLWMKMEVRRLLNHPADRKVISEIMLEVQREAEPQTRVRISELYQSFELHIDAIRELESRRWDRISHAISVLSEMQVTQAYDAIREHVNSGNSIIRKQAQLATICLKEEGIQYFLDTSQFPISQWQQVRIIEILTSKPGFSPPGFRDWLISENQEVVLFALRLIRIFKQDDAGEALLMFLNHRSDRLKIAALECISEFRYDAARKPILKCFSSATPELKIHMLNTLQAIGNPQDIHWLDEQAESDASFMVRSKARLVANALQQESVDEGIGIQGEFDFWTPQPGEDTSRVSVADYAGDDPEADTADALFASEPFLLATLKPDFSTSRIVRPDPKTRQDRKVLELLHETPASFPQEGWSEEEELVFGDCIIEELLDILTPDLLQPPASATLPGFLPLVVDRDKQSPGMPPVDTTPEWIRKLEVHAESLTGSSGYLGILREILLEELQETARVLDVEFVPVSGSGNPPEHKDGANFENDEPLSELFPAFGVCPEEIYRAAGSGDTAYPAPQTAPPSGSFSIFEEFFRSYDTESKLILMDEICAVGGTKELVFLQGLFTDPDPKIRTKARKIHALLAGLLKADSEALTETESGGLWVPLKKNAGTQETQGEDGDTEALLFSFSPDTDIAFPGEIHEREDTCTNSGLAGIRPVNGINKSKNDTDAE